MNLFLPDGVMSFYNLAKAVAPPATPTLGIEANLVG